MSSGARSPPRCFVSNVAPLLAPFVDAERAVVQLLTETAAGNIDVDVPENLQNVLPFVRVSRIGGQGDRWSDSPRIDVFVYCARGSRSSGLTLAQQCQALLLSFPHVTDAGVVDSVETDVPPNEVPWQNSEILLFTSSYKVTVRR